MGQTTSKGDAIGWWTMGGQVYESDRGRITDGVSRGKYVEYAGTNIPEGYEAWINLKGPPPVAYARKLSGFKKWWMKNKAGIVAKVSAAAGIGLEKVSQIAAVVLPILLDASANAAKIAVTEHFGNDPTAMAVAEAIITQVKSAPDGANFGAAREIGGSGQRRNLYAGGVLAKFGGADEDVDMTLLNNYVNSANSKGKKHIIDALVEVAEGLKMKVSGSTPEEKVKSIMANLPQPGQFKKETHKVACEAIAMRLNKAYGSEIVSLKLPAEVICQEISEVLNSLASGMHSEFIAVYNDARRILRNLQILSKTLEESHAKLVAELRAGDEGSRARAANYEGIHDVIKAEIGRQTAMLSGILNSTLAPVDAELSKIMRAGGIKSLIGEVSTDKVGPGTAEFSKFLAEIVKGMGVTAHFAALIENALKTVGMTMQEYAGAKSTQEFRAKIASGMSARDMGDKQFDEYLRAAELLFDNLERREDIRDVAAKSGSGDDDRVDVVGGAPEYEKSAIERRLENRRTERNLYFNTFHKEVNALFDGLLGNINVLSNKVGAEVPLSENLDQFRRCLQRVAYDDEKLLRKGMIYKALLGYFTDATAKQKKEEFINKLRMLSSSAATLAEMAIYASARQYFTDVVTQVGAIIKLIETYSEKLQSKFGRGEEVTGGDDVTGGALEEEPKLKYKAAKSIEESIEMFDFKYRLANIKDNLKISAEETPKFFEGHENKVAISIGNFLADEKVKYDALKAEAGKIPATNPMAGARPDDELAGTNAVEDSVWKKQRAAATSILDEIWETKKAFWLTIEAIDAYLREFTNGMVKSPDDIRDIRSMVENVEVIAEWYNEQSGNNLSDVFSNFPASFTGVDFTVKSVSYDKPTGADKHPYEKIGTIAPGNPLNVTDPLRGISAFDLAEKSIRSFGLLKNFISVFNKIGAKFGGEALSKKIPMTPATMYENLVKFIRVSSFVQGFAKDFDASGKKSASLWANDDLFAAGNECNIRVTINDVNTVAPLRLLGGGVLGEIDCGVGYGAATSSQLAIAANFRRRWGVWMNTVYTRTITEFKDRVNFGFVKENDYFVLAIKALASKLFTIINLQDIMVRPSNYSGLTTARVILGSAEETPKVEKGAVPVYVRLLLLAQFYKKLFGNKEYNAEGTYTLPSNNATFRISLIPEIDGIFSEVMRLVFRKNRGIDHVAYNDDDVKEWIRAVNLVYQKVQSGKQGDIATHVIHDFVAEINRRYGIISKEDIDISDKEITDRYTHGAEKYVDQTADEIPILEGEGDDLPSRPSASVRYLADSVSASANKKSRYQLLDHHQKILRKFRDGFEKYFENANDEYSLGNAIHLAQTKLDAIQDDAARFRVVASLVRGVDVYNKTDSAKYLYFHENVVAGLNTLSAIHSMLARFRQVAVGLDIDQILETMLKTLVTADLHKKPAHFALAYTAVLDGTKIFPDVGLSEIVNPTAIFGGSNDDTYGSADVLVGGANTKLTNGCGVAGGNFASGAAGAATIFNVLDGISAATAKIDLWKKIPDVAEDAKRKALQAYVRHGISNHYIMRTLIETLFALNDVHTGLVTVKIEDGMLYVNFNNVKELVNGLFKRVSHSIELVRPYLSDDLIKKYTDKETAGSYYWLHEQLVEQLFAGRADADGQGYKYITLDDCAKKLSKTYKHLTQKWEADVKLDTGAIKLADVTEANERITYAHLFAEMTHYDTSKHPEIAHASNDANGDAAPSVVDFLTNNMDMLLLSVGTDGKKQLDTRYSVRFKQLYSWNKELNMNRSALMMFNQLVAQFLQNSYDPVTAKMYAGVLKDFNQSNFNRAIIDPTYTYPDMPPALVAKFPGMIEEQFGTDGSLNFLSHSRDKGLFNIIHPMLKDLNTSAALAALVGGAPIPTTLKPALLSTSDIPPFVVLCIIYLYSRVIHMAIDDARADIAAQSATDGIAAGPGVVAAPSTRETYLDVSKRDVTGVGKPWVGVLAGFACNWKDIPGNDELALSSRKTMRELLHTKMGLAFSAADGSLDPFDFESVVKWVLGCAYNAAFTGVAAAVAIAHPATFNDKFAAINTYLKVVNDGRGSIAWPRLTTAAAGAPLGVGAMRTVFNAYAKAANYLSLSAVVFNQSGGSSDKNIGGNVYDALMLTGETSNFNQLDGDDFKRFVGIMIMLSHQEIITDARLYKATLDEIRRAIITPFVKKTRGDIEISNAVRQDDFNAVNYSKWTTEPNISVSSSEKGALFLARADKIDSPNKQPVIKTDSIKNHPLQQPPRPATASDLLAEIIALKGRGDPDGDHVLYTSLARIINTLVSARTAAGTPYYLQENIADIPSYMKERMRANLPGFSALFHALMQRCEFLKRLLDKREINADRSDHTAAFINPYPYVLVNPKGADQEIKTRYSGILDAVSKGCAAIIKSCEQTLREIGDSEVFFETYQGSIKDYKLQNMTDPLMPISSLLTTFNNVIAAEHTNFLPFHSLGDDKFKFLYGARLLLHKLDKQPLLEHAPGYMQLVESFNLMADDKFKEDKKAAEEHFKLLVTAIRYIYSIKHLRGPVVSSIRGSMEHVATNVKPSLDVFTFGSVAKMDLVVGKYINGAPRTAGAATNVYKSGDVLKLFDNSTATDISIVSNGIKTNGSKSVYAIDRPITDVIRITESTAKEDRIKDIVSVMIKPTDVTDSVELRNIIDLNIVPINVHALARDIPLATLYNYGYTFDRMVASAYGITDVAATRKFIEKVHDGTIQANDLGASPTKLMVALMINPYLLFDKSLDIENPDSRQWESLVHMMMLGVNGEGLGRPKYTSDQVFNKVLFGELYPTDAFATMANDGTALMGPPAIGLQNRDLWATAVSSVTERSTTRVAFVKAGLIALHAPMINTLYQDDITIADGDIDWLVNINRNLTTLVNDYRKLSFAAFSAAAFGDMATDRGDIDTLLKKANTAEFGDVSNNDTRKIGMMPHLYVLFMNAIALNRAYDIKMLGSLTATTVSATMSWIPWFAEALFTDTKMTGPKDKVNAIRDALALTPGDLKNTTNCGFDFEANYKGWGASGTNWGGDLKNTVVKFIESIVTMPAVRNGNNRPAEAAIRRLLVTAVDTVDAGQAKYYSYPLSDKLTYPEGKERKTSNKLDSVDGIVKSHKITRAESAKLNLLGRLRFDTMLVRNVLFITNVYRTVSYLMRKSLSYVGDDIARSLPAIAGELTEFVSNQAYTKNQRGGDKQHWKRYNV